MASSSSIPASLTPTSSSPSSLRSPPPPRSTSLRAAGRTSLTSRSTVESLLRLLLTLLLAVPILLLALRDARHLTQLYVWRQPTVSRSVLFLHWRSKTFHIEPRQVDHVVPWGLAVLAIGVMAVGARPGRRAMVPRVAVLAVMAFALLFWTYTDATSIYAQLRPFFTGAVYHQMESILPRQDALAIITLATSLQSRAGQANETDHDWLHLYTAAHGPKVWLLNPDVDVPFPWSFVTVFLVLLAASSLRHRYTVHLSRGRWRFVPRVPDPEYADGDDSWENVADAPTGEEAEQANMAKNVGEKDAAVGNEQRAFAATPPLHRFPLKYPTEAQAAAGRTFHARRATRRLVQRAVFAVLILVVLGMDAITYFSVRSLSTRVASGDYVPTHVFLVVDVAPLEGSAAEVQGRLEEVGRALAGGSGNGTGKAAGAAAAAAGPQLPPKFPMRPIPYIREWKPEYPLPTITFFIIIGLVHLALPPFTTPRARLLVHEDRLVAIPLTYPTSHHTLPFSVVTGIDLRSEDSPHGPTLLRFRRFGARSSRNRRRSPSPSPDALAMPEPYRRRARRVRGYLYAGVGDVGVGAAEDLCVVVVRTEKGFADGDWEVQVQGLDVLSLRDLLADAVGRYKEMVGVDAVA
ncbi:hypothetical protein DFJ73DRAFT_803794 [Zopfochytrium polystomum]|nr:hypothetical protein DFJ73DRAFT_803794 [Zopfochytrium polystomum]